MDLSCFGYHPDLESRLTFQEKWVLGAQLGLGKNPLTIVRGYKTRGIDFFHKAHDWLGGYPYETAAATEIKGRLMDLRFTECRSFITEPKFGGLFATNLFL